MSDAIEFVEVGGTQYKVIKTGRAQADQVLRLGRWVSNHGSRVFAALREDPAVKADDINGVQFLIKFIEHLDTDAVLDLFTVLVGCTAQVSEEYFDVATLIDAALAVYERQPALRRVLDRFFSAAPSKSPMDGQPMTSGRPTGGQTTN